MKHGREMTARGDQKPFAGCSWVDRNKYWNTYGTRRNGYVSRIGEEEEEEEDLEAGIMQGEEITRHIQELYGD